MSETTEMLDRWVAIDHKRLVGCGLLCEGSAKHTETGKIKKALFWTFPEEVAIDIITMAKLRELRKYVHKTYVEMVDITASGNNADEWSIVWKFNGHGYDYFFRAPTLAGAVLAAYEAIEKGKVKS